MIDILEGLSVKILGLKHFLPSHFSGFSFFVLICNPCEVLRGHCGNYDSRLCLNDVQKNQCSQACRTTGAALHNLKTEKPSCGFSG